MQFDYLKAHNSKSEDIDGLLTKTFDEEAVDQLYNICSIFGRMKFISF